jgi:short subunit dehydrogenase-like uncharacterized protein
MSKEYDILLFGVTGFTGRLAAEHLLAKNYGIKWGVSGRSFDKIKAVMSELGPKGAEIPVEVCDIVCNGDEVKLNTLRNTVAKSKVVLTTAGPFEKYGKDLVKLCAELGVHYADITGETDFLRLNIEQSHDIARKSGATIVSHCGHDCIPWDLAVYFLHLEAQKRKTRISEVRTFTEILGGAASGGTVQTIKYQMLEKKREKGKKGFDPLVATMESPTTPSIFTTTVQNPKTDIVVTDVEEITDRYAGPWVMNAVMANCVRRSNALLGYNEKLIYADALLRGGFMDRWADRLYTWKTGLGVFLGAYVHPWFTKAPGDGPSREAMEQASMTLYAIAKLEDGSEVKLTYSIPEDPGYLNTAKMLVESGMTLLLSTKKPAGVVSPAVIGDELFARCKEIGHLVVIT